MSTAPYWIDKLSLQRHPEGGFYRETYRSDVIVPKLANFPGARAASTAIYFLLESGDFSAFHRLRSDEMWHFYVGSTLAVHVIDPRGATSKIRLGHDVESGEMLQAVVPAGYWFGAGVEAPQSFALVGCTVAPGFDFADFELGKRADLTAAYPQHRELIQKLTRS